MDVLSSLIVGLTSGGLYAALGVLLTVMARLTRVINFSQVAVGVFSAFLSIRLVPIGLPAWVGILVAVGVGAVLSAALGWVIARWLAEAGPTARSGVTVAALLGLMSLSDLLFGTRPQPLRPLFVGPAFQFEGIAVTRVAIAMLIVAIAIAASTQLVLTRTLLGVRLRAVSDGPTTAETLGINVTGLQLLVWAVTGGLSAFIVTIVGNAQAGNAAAMIGLLIPAAAAALVGAFRNVWLALGGGLLVGAIQGVLISFPEIGLIKEWVPIVIIVAFLLWHQRREVWDEAR